MCVYVFFFFPASVPFFRSSSKGIEKRFSLLKRERE